MNDENRPPQPGDIIGDYRPNQDGSWVLMPAQRKPRKWPWIVGAVVVGMIVLGTLLPDSPATMSCDELLQAQRENAGGGAENFSIERSREINEAAQGKDCEYLQVH
jgi:hypothetical protein